MGGKLWTLKNGQKITGSSSSLPRTWQKKMATVKSHKSICFFSLIAQEDGLIAEILKSLNTDLETILKEVKAKLDRLSKVSGQTSIYIENDLNQALSEAEKQAKAMQDDFVSVEHLFLGLLSKPNKAVKRHFLKSSA